MPENDIQAPVISIIIVNYNVRALLENCLHSVYSAVESISHEIFVVDNSSDDGSSDMVRKVFPDVILIENESNLGFAVANNIALVRARGSYLLLLNPDTLVQEDTFRIMLSFFEEVDNAGAAGCKIINPAGLLEGGCRRSFPSPWVSFTKLTGLSHLFPNSKLFARYNLTYLSEDETYEVDAISGCFMMIRRDVYLQTGGLDEDYFMYGEDLDWCYRIQQAGWKIYYVHKTKIVHYSGESTRRSSIDAKSVFYDAMRLFVEKNLNLSTVSSLVISAGIRLRLALSRSKSVLLAMVPVFIDAILTVIAVFAAELLRLGGVFRFPSYAYPTVYIAAVLVFVIGLLVAGAYTRRGYSVTRAGVGVLASFLVLSSLTYFFKDYAFSRIVVLLASGFNFVLLPGRRLLSYLIGPRQRSNLITGRPALLVGLESGALEILSKLRSHEGSPYRIVGIIDVSWKHVGEVHGGIEVLGSTDNIGKVIRDKQVSDVIFAPDVVSYSDMLSIIHRTGNPNVHFRIVPKSMEFVAGTTGIDALSGVPLVDVEYNLFRFPNRIGKRFLDLAVAIPGLITLYPFVYFAKRSSVSDSCSFAAFIRSLPRICAGSLSLVGYPEDQSTPRENIYLGKPGLTGLVQLQKAEELDRDERHVLVLHYVRNHSIFLDLEILLRTLIMCILRKKS